MTSGEAADSGGAASIRVLRHTLRADPDPLALFGALTEGCARTDTLLLESSEGTPREPERSILVVRAALRVGLRAGEARIEALSGTGEAMLAAVAGALRARGAEPREDGGAGRSIRVAFAPPDSAGSESERLLRAGPLDAVRALLEPWTVDTPESRALLLAAGVFAYDLIDAVERLPAPHAPDASDDVVPDLAFWVPEQLVLVDHRRRNTTVAAIVAGGAGADARENDARTAIRALADAVAAAPPARPPVPSAGNADGSLAAPGAATAPVERAGPTAADADVDGGGSVAVDLSDAEYAALVTRMKEHVQRGDVFQIVPSRTFIAPCPDALAAYRRLRRLNPSPFMFWVHAGDWTLFGASPESAVTVRADRTVEIRPIAGTAPRGRGADGGIDADLDGRLEAALRLDAKELAEHMMLVDLARNDVARVCVPGTRHVPELLTVDRYSHVMHLVSTVRGTLRPELDALHAYAATMNMGTLMGAPKLKAAELLRRYERGRRGAYGGAVGFLTAAGELRTAIAIRSALVHGGEARVRAGAGVVHDSVPEREALETRRKAAAVLRALEGARA